MKLCTFNSNDNEGMKLLKLTLKFQSEKKKLINSFQDDVIRWTYPGIVRRAEERFT